MVDPWVWFVPLFCILFWMFVCSVMAWLVEAGSLKVVAAMHDVGTGRVMLLGP